MTTPDIAQIIEREHAKAARNFGAPGDDTYGLGPEHVLAEDDAVESDECPEHFLGEDDAVESDEWETRLLRNDKGKLFPCYENAAVFFENSPEWAGVLGYNEFTGGYHILDRKSTRLNS